MTKDESTAILSILRTAYPSFYKNMDPEDIDDTINLWSMMFADESARVVTEAVKSLICTLRFPPTIADVKEKISLITQPQTMTEMEAWQMVRKAISYYNAEDNFKKLPPTIQKIVGGPSQLRDWAVMEADEVNTVIQSNFMRSYTAKMKTEKEYAVLPESTRILIESQKTLKITDGEV